MSSLIWAADDSSLSVLNFRVSSVLNRDIKQFGKKHLFDKKEDTCWNSDQGSPQWILLEFPKLVSLEKLQIQFQGGFCGKECWLEGISDSIPTFSKIENFYPEDNNSLQSFIIDDPRPVKTIKIVFNNSTDFFGRIIIYKLDIHGKYLQ